MRTGFRPIAGVCLALALGVAACGGGSKGSASTGGGSGGGLSGTIKIGAPLDTSGSAGIAVVGTDEQKGEQFAVDEINSSGFLGNAKLDLKVVDTKAAKETAVQTVIDMTRTDKVDAIVGFTLSPSFLAAGPQAQQAKVPTIAVGLSGTGVTEVGDYIFRVYPALVEFYKNEDPKIVKALGAKTAAYFYSSDSSNVAEQYQFRRKQLEGLGIKTVAAQGIATDAIDYQPQLTKIKNANPDVLVVDINGGQDPTFLAQLKQAGLKVPLMGDVGWGAPNVVSDPTAQCAVFTTTWDVDSTAGKNPEFVKAYEAKHGAKPSQYAAWGYDGIWMLATAIKQAGTKDPQKVRDTLAGLKGISGALGDYDIGANRAPTQPGVTFQIRDGKLAPWSANTPCTP
jgi:branched-chain amino acid transport system substrate-binding protein